MGDDSSAPSSPLMIYPILPESSKDNTYISDNQDHYHQRWRPTPSEVVEEIKELYRIAFPMIITGLLIYGKSVISMLFMGRLGKEVLAGGSLSIGFANITGYSVLSGLAMGIEPISSQACGAKQLSLMGHALQRMVLILTLVSLPISLLWLNIEPILLYCGQDPTIASVASTYLAFSLPNLFFQSLLNPLKIYLRTQNITLPLMLSAGFALSLHAPINYLLVYHFGLGVRGIAIAVALTDLNLLVALLVYIYFSGVHRKSWQGWSLECFHEWGPILGLAIPSCASVCLEWWWYELMIVFSGLLANAAEAIATMGILIQTTSLVYIFPSALSLAVSTRVGNELGANRPDRARTSTGVALTCAMFMGFIAMLCTITMRNAWGRAFTADEAIVSLTAAVMPVVGLCELGNCPQTTGCGVLRGCARPSLAAGINLGSFYGVGMPVAMLMGFAMDMGLRGLWLGLLTAQATCALLMMLVLTRSDWVLQASRARQLTGSNDGGGVVEGEDIDGLA